MLEHLVAIEKWLDNSNSKNQPLLLQFQSRLRLGKIKRKWQPKSLARLKQETTLNLFLVLVILRFD